MTTTADETTVTVSQGAIQAFDNVNGGVHAGFRPAHAKGILLSGTFTPAPSAASITRAPHMNNASTPVTVRFSDFAGIPSIADNNADASPRGIAIRFHLAEHVHTDITAHSVDGFPARTAEEFIEFLHAAYQGGSAIQNFLGTHPPALAFVQAPKPFPVSFATESFFAVNAYKFTNAAGASQFVRYRIHPDGPGEYLDSKSASGKGANYLMDEIQERLTKGPVTIHIAVQLAGPGDVVDNSTIHWPADRPQVELGTIELTGVIPNNPAEQRHIIFDPVPRVDGIESSGDPLIEARAAVYLASGRRRRTGAGH